jgi:hypothetical protein
MTQENSTLISMFRYYFRCLCCDQAIVTSDRNEALKWLNEHINIMGVPEHCMILTDRNDPENWVQFYVGGHATN